MANNTYTVLADDAAVKYGVAVGETVKLDLNANDERAVIAAGWLEETTKPKEASK